MMKGWCYKTKVHFNKIIKGLESEEKLYGDALKDYVES